MSVRILKLFDTFRISILVKCIEKLDLPNHRQIFLNVSPTVAGRFDHLFGKRATVAADSDDKLPPLKLEEWLGFTERRA